jgi:dienelactone hydrolase
LKALLAGCLGSLMIISSATQGPSVANQKKLIAEFYKLDRSVEPHPEREQEILAELSEMPPLGPSQAKKWRKDLPKLWKKGPKLKGSGTNYLFEEEERGKYIIAGRTKKPSGLAICMHGGGVGSGSAEGAWGAYQGAISSMGWVGVYPEVLEKTERGWTDSGTEEFVLELVDRAVRTWNVDRDKVYFVGHSMGGYGSWTLGAHHADRVAALAPSAGAPTPYLSASGTPTDLVEGVIPNLRNVPMVIFQSADDPKVPPDVNRLAVKKLEEAKARWGAYPYEYWEVDGRGHGAPPGGFGAHMKKIGDFVRDELPEKVIWQPEIQWKRQFYWLWWESPAKRQIVEAQADWESRTVHIKTKGSTAGLHVLLHKDLVDLDEEFTITVNGKETWRGVPERKLDVMLDTGRHGDDRLTFEARVPVNGTP